MAKEDLGLDTVKKALKEETLIIGTQESIKLLRAGKVKEVLMTTNCPIAVRDDIMRLGKQAKVTELSVTNDELGAVCKKPFAISVVAVK